MNFVIDILILALLGFLAVLGIKKGFIKSACELLGAFAAVFLASYLSDILAELIYNNAFRPGIYEKMLETTGNLSLAAAAENFFTSLEPFVLNFFEMNGITLESVTEAYTGFGEKAALAITDAISPVFISMIKVFVFLVLFIVLLVLITLLSKLLTKIIKLTILKKVNQILGAVLGVLKAVVIVWVVIGAFSVLIPLFPDWMQEALVGGMESSILGSFILSLNPLMWIFK